MRFGLSSYTYGWAVGVPGFEPRHPLDEHGLLEHCHEHGIQLLQIGDNLPLHEYTAARLDRLAERASNEGVQIEVGARRLTMARAMEYVGIARRVGAKLVRFVIDDADHHPTPDEVTAVLREIVPHLDGVTLCLENHDRFTAAILGEMIESVGSNQIGVCLDTANSLGAGEGLETVLARLASLTVNLHLKDFEIARVPHRMGFIVEGRPAGHGFLDIPALLSRVAAIGRCETAVLELWTPPEPQLVATLAKEELWARQSIEYLKPLFR